MRLKLMAPVTLSFFVAAACGGKEDTSQVDGSGMGSGNGSGMGGPILTVGDGAAATGNGSGSDTVDQTSACATTAADGQPVPVDLYFMVDITGSMNCPVPDQGPCILDPGPPDSGESRWTLLSAALKSFIAEPKNQGLGMGMGFFPTQTGKLCSVSSYLTPAVEVGPLSATAMLLTTTIGAQEPGGSTPTSASLSAAIQHATIWASAHPTRRVAVVYATDGYPKGCRNDQIEGAAMIAQAGFAQQPSIPTYVLGVGPNLTNLEQIATAGSNGKTKAFLVDTTQNAAAQLSAALGSIRTSAALDCAYTIPAPTGGAQLDPNKVNVTYTNSKGVVSKLKRDPADTACSAGAGWQYSADGKQITLCGSACTAVKADPGGKIQLLFGCATQIGAPPK